MILDKYEPQLECPTCKAKITDLEDTPCFKCDCAFYQINIEHDYSFDDDIDYPDYPFPCSCDSCQTWN